VTDPILARLREFVAAADLAEFVETCERMASRGKNGEAAVTVVFRAGKPLQAKLTVAGYVESKQP
jgi:hypothetical protein